MKYCAILLVAVVFMLSCSQKYEIVQVTGTLHYENGAPTDTVYVGLYDHSLNKNLGTFRKLVKTLDSNFAIEIERGFYIIAVYGRDYEPFRKQLLLDEKAKNVHLDIILPRIGIPETISTVKLNGECNNWKAENAVPLSFENNKWILENPSIMQPDQNYEFIIDGLKRWNPADTNCRVSHGWCNFVNFYSAEIIFDPKNYRQPRVFATANLTGVDDIDFNSFITDLDSLKNSIMPYYRRMPFLTSKDVDSVYFIFENEFKKLSKKYGPPLDQIILNEQIYYLSYLHPVYFKRKEVAQTAAGDTTLISAFKNSQELYDYIVGQIDLFHRLDANSYVLSGTCASRMLNLDDLLNSVPAVNEKLNLPDQYVANFCLDFAEGTKSKNCAVWMLYSVGTLYALSKYPDKLELAEEVLARIPEIDPYHMLVKRGYIAQNLRRLRNTKIGNPAPDFALWTMDGTPIHLTNFRGKFLLMDFWGTWCAPCRHEIPNFVKLHTSVSNDSLLILGVANDDSTKLVSFIDKMKIPYMNAEATSQIITDYGVTGYPTTFLIDPDGKILMKDLRGPEVVKMVRSAMKNYYEKQSS